MSDNSSPDTFDWSQFLADEALWNLEYGYTDGKYSLMLVSLDRDTVPEPATWAILVLGTAGVFVARNRNRKKN